MSYNEYHFYKQLQAFHGDDTEALEADVQRVLANHNLDDHFNEPIAKQYNLSSLFTWSDTPEGHRYWFERNGSTV